MMKDIKFKAWDKKDKKMRIVTRITFGLEPTGHPAIIVHLDDGKDPVTRSINDVDLLQYTGRKDKSGVEIYEDNILKGSITHSHSEKDEIGLVRFGTFIVDNSDDEYGSIEVVGWYLEPIKIYEGRLASKISGEYIWNELEIIGSKYENPELLEGK